MMKGFRNYLFLTIAIIICNCTFGQLSTKEHPISFSYKNIKSIDSIIILPELDMKTIATEDLEDEEKGQPPRFGYKHNVNITLDNSGEWEILEDGSKLWRLSIKCSDALSINLLYDKFWLPEGAKLFIYSNDKKYVLGAFTSLNNKGTLSNLRGFATGLIYGDNIILEYYVPSGINEIGVISISHVVHGYRYISIYDEAVGFRTSGECQVNVNCEEGQNWQNEKNAIALILINGNRWCTGSLINNTAQDNQPLLLTASHCLYGHDAINNPELDDYSFWWNYESPDCNTPTTKPIYYTTTGAKILANKSASNGSDFALLYLTEDPRNCLGVRLYYLGWDNSGFSGSSFVGIHHPSGDIKK